MKLAILGTVAVLLAGCAAHRVDSWKDSPDLYAGSPQATPPPPKSERMPSSWHQRVGRYTYLDAVQEFGPPSRETFVEAKRIAAWDFAGRGGFTSSNVVGNTIISNTARGRGESIILTFDSANVLEAWRVRD